MANRSVICYRIKGDRTVHIIGTVLSERIAQLWVEQMNREFPYLEHWIKSLS